MQENKLFLCRSADDELRSVIAWGKRLLCSLGEGQQILRIACQTAAAWTGWGWVLLSLSAAHSQLKKLALYVSANHRYTFDLYILFLSFLQNMSCHVWTTWTDFRVGGRFLRSKTAAKPQTSVQDSISTFWSTKPLDIYCEMSWYYSAVVLAKIISFLW